MPGIDLVDWRGRFMDLEHLFETSGPWRRYVRACLRHGLGRISVEHVTRPKFAVLEYQFNFVAGDALCPSAEAWLRSSPCHALLVPLDPRLEQRLLAHGEHDFVSRPAWEFRRHHQNLDQLMALVKSIPDAYVLGRSSSPVVESAQSEQQSEAARSSSLPGIKSLMVYEGAVPVARAVSFPLSRREFSLGVETHHVHRRLGLASSACATLLLEGLLRGWRPSWYSVNEASRGLADQLGFHSPREFVYLCRDMLPSQLFPSSSGLGTWGQRAAEPPGYPADTSQPR